MSRIGKKPIIIPEGVEISADKNKVLVKGPRGSLQKKIPPHINIQKEDGKIIVLPAGDSGKLTKALYGLTRSLIANMIEGVSKGFEKILEISGVGYKAKLQERDIILSLGFSHQITYQLPVGIDVNIEKQTIINLIGIDKELIGQVAADIRNLKAPEPYKGKGIRYKGERIIKKAGKAGK